MKKKFTLAALLIAASSSVMAQETNIHNPLQPSDITSIDSKACFTIAPADSAGANQRGRWTYKPANLKLDSIKAGSPITDNDLFCFVKIGDSRYLYSVGAGKFVTPEKISNDAQEGTTLTDLPVYPVVLVPSTGTYASTCPTVLAFEVGSQTVHFGISHQNGNHILGYNSTDDAGNVSAIKSAGKSIDLEKMLYNNVKGFLSETGVHLTADAKNTIGATSLNGTCDIAMFKKICDAVNVTSNLAVDLNGYYLLKSYISSKQKGENAWTKYGHHYYLTISESNNKVATAIVLDNDNKNAITAGGNEIHNNLPFGSDVAQVTPANYALITKKENGKYNIKIKNKYVGQGIGASNDPVDVELQAHAGGWITIKTQSNGGVDNQYTGDPGFNTKDYLNTNSELAEYGLKNDSTNKTHGSGTRGIATWSGGAGSFWLPIPAPATYTQTLSAKSSDGYVYGTASYPFAYQLPEGAEAWIVTNCNGGTLTCQKINNTTIPAGTAVILRKQSSSNSELLALTLDPTNAATATTGIEGNLLKGTNYHIINWGGEGSTHTNDYVFGTPTDGQPGFYTWTNSSTGFFPNFRCYLPASAVTASNISSAKSFALNFGGETTGIETLQPTSKAQSNVIYDLQGRRVEKATKGIFIINGKKVIK